MKLIADLWKDRTRDGQCWLEDEQGANHGGPWPCRGKADQAYASRHGNVERDSTKIGGDTPTGLSRFVTAVSYPTYSTTYGWVFIALDGQDGDAKEAERNGRTGLGLHSGVPDDQGRLRATYGCLRSTDDCLASVMSWLGHGPVYCEVRES